ncbi:hypothetical protein J7400_19045 [Shimia sp. R9_2]|uniref:hypothetical protein n=1 Tax=Shimia sp. R9_2 TaxID=2821112 RepID=UPI001ADB37CF|nr:hypothetical protein [Shimia sp. R9_2]MBO9398775.1 hypothetical protein [Shimia sp. R9_2]
MTDVSKDSLTQIEQLMLCVENDLSEPCLDTLWDEVKALTADRDEWKEVAVSLKASTEAQAARLQELGATIEGWESLCDLRFDEAETWRKKAAELEAMQGVVKPLEWDDNRAQTMLGVYTYGVIGRWWEVYLNGSGVIDGDEVTFCKAVRAAKAAAQADYQRRYTTPPADDTAEAEERGRKEEREACAKKCDEEAEFWLTASERSSSAIIKSEYAAKASAIRATAATIRARREEA